MVDSEGCYMDERAIESLAEKVMAGTAITWQEALALTGIPDDLVPALAAAAGRVRRHFSGDKVDLCSITNARSGKCSEDCKFCAQSAHYHCDTRQYPMRTAESILAAAEAAESRGAHRFCIVTSGGELSDADFAVVLYAVADIRTHTRLQRCASLGRLSKERAEALAAAGLCRYHHNLETSRSFFPSVCTTHAYDERVETVRVVKDSGIETCVGGILNLGESPAERLEFAFELRDLEPDSVPINFLNPRPGTPLESRPPLRPREAVKYLAIFRLIMPTAIVRLAGGRAETLGDEHDLGISAGVNGMLIGDLLTTQGTDVEDDLERLTRLGFDIDQSA